MEYGPALFRKLSAERAAIERFGRGAHLRAYARATAGERSVEPGLQRATVDDAPALPGQDHPDTCHRRRAGQYFDGRADSRNPLPGDRVETPEGNMPVVTGPASPGLRSARSRYAACRCASFSASSAIADRRSPSARSLARSVSSGARTARGWHCRASKRRWTTSMHSSRARVGPPVVGASLMRDGEAWLTRTIIISIFVGRSIVIGEPGDFASDGAKLIPFAAPIAALPVLIETADAATQMRFLEIFCRHHSQPAYAPRLCSRLR